MPSFIMAMKICPGAKKQHPDLAHYVNQSLEAFVEAGIKIEHLWATLGRFDYLAKFETPDQETVFAIATRINSQAVLETETWPVIPLDEQSRLMG
jgi:uncharacterized protein with GYD domain